MGIADAESPDDTMPKLWLEKDVTLKSYEVNASNWLIVNPGGYGRLLQEQQLATWV